jgi:transposase
MDRQQQPRIPETRHYGPGSDSGGRHWAVVATLIETCRLNGIEPWTWLTDVLERIVSGRTRSHELHTLLPWNWKPPNQTAPAQAA